jgi:hypothetical protein
MFGFENLSWGLSDEEQNILESAAIEATHRQRATCFHRAGQRFVVEVEPDLYFVIHRRDFLRVKIRARKGSEQLLFDVPYVLYHGYSREEINFPKTD